MWAFFLKLIFNKYTLGAIAALILFLAVNSAVNSIKTAYSERARFHQQTIEQATEIEAISAQRNAQVAAANATSEALRNEIATRDRLATEAAARGAKLQKDLTNAQASIRKWRDQASPAGQPHTWVPALALASRRDVRNKGIYLDHQQSLMKD